MKKTTILIACAALLFSCQQPTASEPKAERVAAANSADVEARVKANNERFREAIVKGDSASISALYTADAKVFPPNAPAMDRAGIGAMAAQIPSMGIKKFVVATSDVVPSGDMFIETGTWEMGDGTKVFDKGKYLVVWKQEGDELKMFRDVWNSDNPLTR